MANQYKQISLQDCITYAKQKNGKCKSLQYVNAQKPLIWECENGHIFPLAWKHIQYYKSWCPLCPSNVGEEICRLLLKIIFGYDFPRVRPSWLKYKNHNLELDGYCSELNIAFEYNGSQHYKTHSYFHKSFSDLSRQKARDVFKYNKCAELNIKTIVIPELFYYIRLKDLPSFLRKECERLDISVSFSDAEIANIDLSIINANKSMLEHYKKVAVDKNGECISNAYLFFHDKLMWRCEFGHTWEACGYSVEGGTWCPKCAGKNITIEDANLIAASKDGVCLSKKCLKWPSGRMCKLEWQCKNGHVWKEFFSSVRKGAWCKKCAT